jgi:clan AA aspartic protease
LTIPKRNGIFVKIKIMGLVRTVVKLSNPRQPEKSTDIKCLVDSGSTHMCIPESMAIFLGLEVAEIKDVELADGSFRQYPYVGPIKVEWGGRTSFTGALVMGKEPLLGAIPMEDMDILVHPKLQKLVINPTPYRPYAQF